MERSLGLIAGAGPLPARMAAEARRQGWRIVAFAFKDAPGLEASADVVVPSRPSELGAVLAGLQQHGASAAVVAGSFSLADLLASDRIDDTTADLARRTGRLIDTNMTEVLVATLAGVGVTLLDQRAFLGDVLEGSGCWSARQPTSNEWDDIRRGLAVARLVAQESVGQTVVVRRGAIAAVEAFEGTTEAVRRGTALAGAGAVIVKATAPGHDYRFDTPSIGPETVEAAVVGQAAVLAVEATRVFIVDRLLVAKLADAAGLALLSVA